MLVCVINHSLALHPMATAWDILVWNTDTHEQINKLLKKITLIDKFIFKHLDLLNQQLRMQSDFIRFFFIPPPPCFNQIGHQKPTHAKNG